MANIAITAANVASSATGAFAFDTFHSAGAEITAGQFCYLDDSDQWQLVDADNATGTEATRTFGIALNHAYTDQPIAVSRIDADFVVGGTLTAGVTYYASTTPGAICLIGDLSAGDYPVAVGVAKSTTVLNLNPTAAGSAL